MTFTFFPIIGNYEVLPSEPLHDIKEHIANVLTELPSHLENEEKNAFQDIIECSLECSLACNDLEGSDCTSQVPH